MSEYPGREAHEVYAAGSQLANDTARLAILVATLIAEQIAENRRRKYVTEAAASEARAAAQAERLRAERAAAQPLLSAVHQERFWRDADPARIGRSWQAAAEWAASDPYAAHTLATLRENLRERFGVEVPEWPLAGADLSRVLAVADPSFRRVLQDARDGAAAAGRVSYAVTISDLNDPSRILHTSELTVPAGMSVDEAAARAYDRWATSAEGAVAADRHDQYAVQLSENTGEARSSLTPAATLRGDRVGQVLAEAESRRRAIVEGTEEASDAELAHALAVELDQLTQEEDRRRARRGEYAARLTDPSISDQDRKRLAGNVAAIDEGLHSLHRRQADAALRLAATTAAMRGENPRHVYDAARLRESLDPGWWSTASAGEIAGAWEYVHGWSPGNARDEMQTMLREEVMSRYGVPIGMEARGADVAASFGGARMPGPATRLRDQGEVLREQAGALFDLSVDAFSKASAASDHGQKFPEEDPARAQTEGQTAYYMARAAAYGAEGLDLLDRGTWLYDQDEGATAAALGGAGAVVVEQLAAEYEERFGRPLHPQAREQLREAAAEVHRTVNEWQVQGTEGSANPAEFKVIPGYVVAEAEPWRPDPETLREAAQAVVDAQFGSTSMLERKLHLSYDEAARYMGELERLGIISAADGRGRNVLVQAHDERYVQLLRDGESDRPMAPGAQQRADALNVSLGIPPQGAREADRRYEERAAAADEVLADLGDQEAAGAVSVAAQGFPQSPDVVTDSPPVSARSGQGNGPQLGRERGNPGLDL